MLQSSNVDRVLLVKGFQYGLQGFSTDAFSLPKHACRLILMFLAVTETFLLTGGYH